MIGEPQNEQECAEYLLSDGQPRPVGDNYFTAAARKATYSDGLRDGVLMLLDHIEGAPGAQSEPYTGPLPDELRAWLAGVRRRA